MKRYVFFFSCVVLAISIVACGQKHEPINIGGNTWLGYQPYYVAKHFIGCSGCPQQDKFIDSKPFEINILPSTTLTLRLFAAGELDAALLTFDEAIGFQSRTQIDICVAQILSYSNGADAVVVMSDFDARETIRFGNEQSALGGFMVARTATILDWPAQQIEQVLVNPPRHVDALLNAEVDAIVTYEPYLSQLISRGGKVIFSSANIPGEIIDVLVVRTKVWNRHRSILTWLSEDYWQQGRELLNENRDASLAFIAEVSGAETREIEQALAGIYFPPAHELRTYQDGLGDMLKRLNQYLIDYGQIETPAQLAMCPR